MLRMCRSIPAPTRALVPVHRATQDVPLVYAPATIRRYLHTHGGIGALYARNRVRHTGGIARHLNPGAIHKESHE
jgi:hypothetical protein